jgi:aldehyde dehydrogenase (NAD+)
MYVGMNYIDGEFTRNRPDFSSYCPYTEEPIGIFPMSQPMDVCEAVDAAKKAFLKWRSLSRVVRAEYFDRLCQVLKARSQGIAHMISQETGKPLNESVAEVNEALHMAQYTFGMGRMPCGEVIASEIAAKDSYVFRKPKGVIGVIAPWNFPFAIGGFWCAAPALLEGNTVVFKPSEDTPIVGQIIAELYNEAGFPPGVFNLIHGDGVVGSLLVRHHDVVHICFTGSAQVGRDIRKACANSWDKSCSCEMGSKSAVIVFADADMDLALAACVASAYKLSGQRCVSAGRLIVEHQCIMEFMAKFVEMSQKIKIGDPFEENVFMGPIINASQRHRIEGFNEKTKCHSEDIQILLEGKRLDRKGYFLTPHIYTGKWRPKNYYQGSERATFFREEVFGPHVAIIPFDDLDEAIDIYNDTEYGLSLGVCTNDFKKARECRDRCDFGLGYWNGGSIAAESHLPFGGVKKSGNGWPSAAGTFQAVIHEVTWTVNHGPLAFPQGLR